MQFHFRMLFIFSNLFLEFYFWCLSTIVILNKNLISCIGFVRKIYFISIFDDPTVETTQHLGKNIFKWQRQTEKCDADTCLPKLEPVKRVALIFSFWMTTSLRRSIFFKRELASFSVFKIKKEKRLADKVPL